MCYEKNQGMCGPQWDINGGLICKSPKQGNRVMAYSLFKGVLEWQISCTLVYLGAYTATDPRALEKREAVSDASVWIIIDIYSVDLAREYTPLCDARSNNAGGSQTNSQAYGWARRGRKTVGKNSTHRLLKTPSKPMRHGGWDKKKSSVGSFLSTWVAAIKSHERNGAVCVCDPIWHWPPLRPLISSKRGESVTTIRCVRDETARHPKRSTKLD